MRRSRGLAVLVLVGIAMLTSASAVAAVTGAVTPRCDGVKARTGPSTAYAVKALLSTGTVVNVVTEIAGSSWSSLCAGHTISGSTWAKIDTINGKTVRSLYGVDVVYAAAGLLVAVSQPSPSAPVATPTATPTATPVATLPQPSATVPPVTPVPTTPPPSPFASSASAAPTSPAAASAAAPSSRPSTKPVTPASSVGSGGVGLLGAAVAILIAVTSVALVALVFLERRRRRSVLPRPTEIPSSRLDDILE